MAALMGAVPLLLGLLAGVASAEAVSGETARYSVFRVGTTDENQVGYFGSSFYVGQDEGGAQVLLTNYHVVEPNENAVFLYIGNKAVACAVVAKDAAKDLAVLKPASYLGAQAKPLPLGKEGGVTVADVVFALGFPTADISENLSSLPEDVSVSRGGVSKKTTWQGARYYQIDAAINKGNSGGPLLHEKGFVIGICTMKMDNAERIGGAIMIEEALPLLDGLKVDYSLLSASDSPGASLTPAPSLSGEESQLPASTDEAIAAPKKDTVPIWLGLFALSALLFFALLIYLLILRLIRKRRAREERFLEASEPRLRAYAQVLGVHGVYMGSVVPLGDETLFFGRDPQRCQIVFAQGQAQISRVHCSLRYDVSRGVFVLENYSKNGTFLEGGRAVEDGRPAHLRDGARFYLADEANLFELKAQ
ncbi:MAG: trypsin-like peptidase domain-containing protein [Christensenellaceae bacterium]|nr:trypsin-like peptidase domain-containing protein [Christensenellaceae bacterium]